MKFLNLYILFILSSSQYLLAQEFSPKYLSFSNGSDLNTEKIDRILNSKPTFLSLSFEKRLAQSELYGLGIYAHHFTSEYDNYNHFSIRAYQHFGEVSNTSSGNIDPYIGVLVGVDAWQKTLKPALGIFGGIRLMLTKSIGVHAEIASISSGFTNSLISQFGITSCFMKNDSPKLRKYHTKCPKI